MGMVHICTVQPTNHLRPLSARNLVNTTEELYFALHLILIKSRPMGPEAVQNCDDLKVLLYLLAETLG